MEIRIATENDAADFLAIYSQYITAPITFEYELPPFEEFARRIRETLREYPYLAGMEAGKVCGFACARRFQTREAYAWGAELSVYLDSGVTSRGFGRELYSSLIALLKQQGVRTVYGCVTMPNIRSERLHENFGFRKTGIFRNAGFKNGAWHDIVWYEKAIAPYDSPEKLRPFPEIAGNLPAILNQ